MNLCISLAPVFCPMPTELMTIYYASQPTGDESATPGVSLSRAEEQQWEALVRNLR
jgi:hypothetical protein